MDTIKRIRTFTFDENEFYKNLENVQCDYEPEFLDACHVNRDKVFMILHKLAIIADTIDIHFWKKIFLVKNIQDILPKLIKYFCMGKNYTTLDYVLTNYNNLPFFKSYLHDGIFSCIERDDVDMLKMICIYLTTPNEVWYIYACKYNKIKSLNYFTSIGLQHPLTANLSYKI